MWIFQSVLVKKLLIAFFKLDRGVSQQNSANQVSERRVITALMVINLSCSRFGTNQSGVFTALQAYVVLDLESFKEVSLPLYW